jgi:hypothetical protein
MRRYITGILLSLVLILHWRSFGQNAVIIVIDGGRYSETFGAEDLYLPRIWHDLRPKGTIWTNFRNDGLTSTVPGHASIITGTWQKISNEGKENPAKPTIFEYFRKSTGASKNSVAIVSGKSKLHHLIHSNASGYGARFGSSYCEAADDKSVTELLKKVLARDHPKIALVSLSDVDNAGHTGNRAEYTASLRTADSLIYVIWQTLQNDTNYHGRTTVFITNDHGRHDDLHGGFKKHGDDCEGCRHIMLLAAGEGIPAGGMIDKKRDLRDIVPTIGKLLGFPTEYAQGVVLLDDLKPH